MKVYGIKNCASVKKALEFFKTNTIVYEFIDIEKTPVGEEKISQWLNFIDAKSLLNPRSKGYRENDLKNKKLTDKKIVKLLEKNNGILKRPIIEHGLNGENKFTIGFNEELYSKEFLSQ